MFPCTSLRWACFNWLNLITNQSINSHSFLLFLYLWYIRCSWNTKETPRLLIFSKTIKDWGFQIEAYSQECEECTAAETFILFVCNYLVKSEYVQSMSLLSLTCYACTSSPFTVFSPFSFSTYLCTQHGIVFLIWVLKENTLVCRHKEALY